MLLVQYASQQFVTLLARHFLLARQHFDQNVLIQQALNLMQMLLHVFSVMRFVVFGHDALSEKTATIVKKLYD
jgi:hypothetical protein